AARTSGSGHAGRRRTPRPGATSPRQRAVRRRWPRTARDSWVALRCRRRPRGGGAAACRKRPPTARTGEGPPLGGRMFPAGRRPAAGVPRATTPPAGAVPRGGAAGSRSPGWVRGGGRGGGRVLRGTPGRPCGVGDAPGAAGRRPAGRSRRRREPEKGRHPERPRAAGRRAAVVRGGRGGGREGPRQRPGPPPPTGEAPAVARHGPRGGPYLLQRPACVLCHTRCVTG